MSGHKYHPCEQYGEEWSRLRIGIPTASSFSKIITPAGSPTKSSGETRLKYKYRLVAERLLQQCMDDHPETYWMRRGSELEDQAIEALIEHVDGAVRVDKGGGFFTALGGRVGASPDGFLAGTDDGVEIKCPAPYTHVGYLIAGPGDDYKAQVQGQMFVCRYERVHFWSWHPAMPPHYEVFHRDEDFIRKLVPALAAFCAEVDEAEAHCRGLGRFKLAEQLRLSDEMESTKTVGGILERL